MIWCNFSESFPEGCCGKPENLNLWKGEKTLAGESANKILFCHVIFKCLASINKEHRHFVAEFAAEIGVGVHINFAPGEAASAMDFNNTFLHNLTKVASFAGVNDHFSYRRHC